MADRVEHFEVAVSAGQTGTDGLSFASGDGVVRAILVHFPKGCADMVEVKIRYADSQVIPFDRTKFLTGNGRTYRFPTRNYPTSNAWSMVAFNQGRRDHTLRVSFEIDNIEADDLSRRQTGVILLPFRA